MEKLISIVDDEADILELVSIQLERANFRTLSYQSATTFIKDIRNQKPDLLILDLMLPDMDGIEVCKFLRSEKDYSNIPIIMLTARGDEVDKILGLELGADDYITKPFSVKELLARVKAVLRRTGKKENKDKKININDTIIIDLQRYEVRVNEEKINLTPTEFKILKILSNKIGWVYSRDQILDYLWGNDKAVLDRTIDVHIKHLREKLGPNAGKYIKNIRGIGYKLEI